MLLSRAFSTGFKYLFYRYLLELFFLLKNNIYNCII